MATISARFWQSLTQEEFNGILDRGGILNADLCQRLWQIDKHPGEPPEAMEIKVMRDALLEGFNPPRSDK